MSDANRPPLWRALKAADASWTSDFTSQSRRALIALASGMGGERQRLRALLTAEADRAERGDD